MPRETILNTGITQQVSSTAKNGDRLQGKEYDTQFYSANDTLVQEKFSDWNWVEANGSANMTFFPNSDNGTPGADGSVQEWGPETYGLTWAQIHDGSGSYAYPSNATIGIYLRKASYSGWWILNRVITGFDTSALPDSANITAATLSIYGSEKGHSVSFSPSINVYSASPATTDNVVAGDYDSLGATAFSTSIAYDDFSTTGYNNFQLNQDGIATVNKTGVTNFGWRDVVEADNTSEPNGSYTYPAYMYFYSADAGVNTPKLVVSYPNWAVQLASTNETVGNKTSRTRYEYDIYGNVKTTYLDGDISIDSDNSTVHYLYSANATKNIVAKVARERVYSGTVTADDGGSNLKKETFYSYDNATSYLTPPSLGNLTRIQQTANATASANTYFTYDPNNGNKLSSQDANRSTTNWTYETNFNTYPASKTDNATGLSESYHYNYGTTNLKDMTDINGVTTNWTYDKFQRLVSVIKLGDPSSNASIVYDYTSWGNVTQQNIETETKVATGNYAWQKQYFDGLGRVIQTQSSGDSGNVTISSTTTYNNRGLAEKQYISQVVNSANVSGYFAPQIGWRYSTSAYDSLGRVTIQTNADNTTITHDYSAAWTDNVTNQLGYRTIDYYDAFGRLIKVGELSNNTAAYATTYYTYDVLGNLVLVKDANNNTTNVTYDMLSQKTGMSDPDMGTWSYVYDSNGNLMSQTDAKNQTTNFTYDTLNRLTVKSYPSTANMTDVTYSYDNVTGGNYGKGRRTAMTDALGTTYYTYDNRGRLISENRIVTSDNNNSYVTKYGYDSADRNIWVLYPTGENVTQTFNNRGLPNSLSCNLTGTVVNFVKGTLYNQLGIPTQINLGNSVNTTYSYWGIGSGPVGGYYGQLSEIKTVSSNSTLQDMQHTWDAGGNLVNRYNVLNSDNGTFGYDPLDRLTSESGNYSGFWSYTKTGNILPDNQGTVYIYGSKPHALASWQSTYPHTGDVDGDGFVTQTDADLIKAYVVHSANLTSDQLVKADVDAGGSVTILDASYIEQYLAGQLTAWPSGQVTAVIQYDANGNMVSNNTSGNKTITWDVENRPVSMTVNGVTTNLTYDGDGNRVKQTVGGNTTLYVNKYYEKSFNLTTSTNTTYYYLGGTLVAMKQGTANVTYFHQDNLGGTSVVSDSSGALVSSISYSPFGLTRSGSLPTSIKFTGQRLDDATGLYYYGARYYDPAIGRFISPDTLVQNKPNPQTFNRYSYVSNNPMRRVDPTGLDWIIVGGVDSEAEDLQSWYDGMMANNLLDPGEAIYYFWDTDPEGPSWIPDEINLMFDRPDAAPRLADVEGWLSDSDRHLSNLKMVGFSEGAAAVGELMSKYVNGPLSGQTNANLSSLQAVFLVETPTGIAGNWVQNYSQGDLANIGNRLEKDWNVHAVDIFNSTSFIDFGHLEGWNKVDTATRNDTNTVAASLGGDVLSELMSTTSRYHNREAEKDWMTVAKSILKK